MSLYRDVRKQIILDLSRVYLRQNQVAPKGIQIHQGTRNPNSRYYNTEDVTHTRPESTLDQFHPKDNKTEIIKQAFLSAIKEYGTLQESTHNGENPVSTVIADKIGFHGKPKMVTAEEISKLESTPTTTIQTLRRGVGGNSTPGFMEGTNTCQRNGVYGSGIYTVACQTVSLDYNKLGVSKEILDKIAVYDSAKQLYNEQNDKLQTAVKINEFITNFEKYWPQVKQVIRSGLSWEVCIDIKNKHSKLNTIIQNAVGFAFTDATKLDPDSSSNWYGVVKGISDQITSVYFKDEDDIPDSAESVEPILDAFDINTAKEDMEYNSNIEDTVRWLTDQTTTIKKQLDDTDNEVNSITVNPEYANFKKDVLTMTITQLLQRYPCIYNNSQSNLKESNDCAIIYAQSTTRSTGAKGEVISFAVDPSANIGEYESIKDMALNPASLGFSEDDPNYDKVNNGIMWDLGLKAMLLGYDGYRIHNPGSSSYDYIVMLNRSKLMMAPPVSLQ